MRKYQLLFLSKLNKEKERLYDSSLAIKKEDLLTFLHTVKGTAPTIELYDLGNLANKIYQTIDQKEITEGIPVEKVKHWLDPLFSIGEDKQSIPKDLSRTPEVSDRGMPAPHNGTILIIDDDITLLTYMRDLLEKEGYTTVIQIDYLKAFQAFYDASPDLIVLDYQLRGTDGFQWLDTMKEKADLLLIPVVMVSANLSKETRLSAYEAGLDDYIEKPFEPDEFIIRVKAALNRKRLLREAVLVDELTGAFNRKFMQRSLSRHTGLFEEYGLISSLILIDLDHFKSVNDTYGHPVGDQVLKRFAHFIRENKRQSDSLIRIGGEEFLIVLPNTGQVEAYELGVEWLHGFSELTHRAEDRHFKMTFSAGLIEINKAGVSNESWFEQVDQALYQAKTNGRNQIVVYDNHVTLPKNQSLIQVAIVEGDEELQSQFKSFLLNGEIKEKRHVTYFKQGDALLDSDWKDLEGFHILILNSRLPDQTGFNLLARLKQKFQGKSLITLMLMDHYHTEDDLHEAIELGVDDFMIKPFQLDELERRFMQLINRFVRRAT